MSRIAYVDGRYLLHRAAGIDDQIIGNGMPGLLTLRLRELYLSHAAAVE